MKFKKTKFKKSDMSHMDVYVHLFIYGCSFTPHFDTMDLSELLRYVTYSTKEPLVKWIMSLNWYKVATRGWVYVSLFSINDY